MKNLELWKKLEAEGKAAQFDDAIEAAQNGYTVIAGDGWYLKGGIEIPKAAFPNLFAAFNSNR